MLYSWCIKDILYMHLKKHFKYFNACFRIMTIFPTVLENLCIFYCHFHLNSHVKIAQSNEQIPQTGKLLATYNPVSQIACIHLSTYWGCHYKWRPVTCAIARFSTVGQTKSFSDMLHGMVVCDVGRWEALTFTPLCWTYQCTSHWGAWHMLALSLDIHCIIWFYIWVHRHGFLFYSQ